MDGYLSRLLERAPHLYAWEKEYRAKGKLWRGVGDSFDFALLPRGCKVLELGCGDGKTLSSLVSRGFKVTGIDISPSAVELAKEKVGKKAKLIVGDVCDLPFAANSFDAVVAVHVLDHLSEKERKVAVSEIQRVLKKGGVLFFEGFSKQDFRFAKGIEIERNTFRRGNNVWYHYFSLVEAKRLFSKFKLVEAKEKVDARSVAGLKVNRAVVQFIGRK
ncbi:MAG: class I SAM-dependent methyltransferase [Candidatus Micrarchaeota archaeon]